MLTAFTGIALLGRMSPAIDQVLQENVFSTAAVEEMLGILAVRGKEADFLAALARAEGNITEEEERPLLETIRNKGKASFGGDWAARRETVAALHQLGAVNRASMERANAAASQLGLAGAWAMALLGFSSFLLSAAFARRVQTRLLDPVMEVDAVLGAVRQGDTLRRANPSQQAPEAARALRNLNWLLDQRAAPPDSHEDPALRAALNALLDPFPAPTFLYGPGDAILGANRAALDLPVDLPTEEARWEQRPLTPQLTLRTLRAPAEGSGDLS